MNTFALDTNIISYLLKGDKNIATSIAREKERGNDIVIPPIAYYEIMRGLLAAGATTKTQIFEKLCASTMVGDIDRAVLDIAATNHAALRKSGISVEDADLLIGAYCVRNAYTLVTNNTKHFVGINGLKYVNWV